MTIPFGRLLTAMITPFDSDGAVDHGRVWELAHHLVDTGSATGSWSPGPPASRRP